MNAWIRTVALAVGVLGAMTSLRAQEAPSVSSAARPDVQVLLEEEKARLERFLSGEGYNYFVLEMKLREVLPKVDLLMSQRQYAAAQEALAPLAALRPLDDIPHVGLTMRRLVLMHETGQTVGASQLAVRYALLPRAVAGDRDGLSESTAIEVPFVEFEYAWLSRRGLKREHQQLRQGERSYDVLDVIDRDGRRATYYFDVTRLVKLRLDGINQAKP